MKRPGLSSFALLGLLAMRPWTGYELTQQVGRSLQFVWPTSEASLYRDQQGLVRAGWATVIIEPVGRRTRKRYDITPEGRVALEEWLATEPAPPMFGVEGIVRTWLADQGTPQDLTRSLRSTAGHARGTINAMLPLLESYLAPTAPFPERAQVNVLAAVVLIELLDALDTTCTQIADETARWKTTQGRTLDTKTRKRIERILVKHLQA